MSIDMEIENKKLKEMYEELRKKYRILEKEYKNLQVEHSRMLFDMDAVIEYEVKVKYKKLRNQLKQLKIFINNSI